MKPFLGEVLTCSPDDREESRLHDTNVLGAFKVSSEKANSETILFGHIAMELSFLLKSFLNNDKTDKITASIIGSRKRVVPCLYRARTQKLKVNMRLHKELMSTKEICQHMDVIVKELKTKKFALTDFIRNFCIDSARESSLFYWVLIPQYTTQT